MDITLLTTKLQMPPPQGVHRTRLMDSLEQRIPQHKLILLAAPAGSARSEMNRTETIEERAALVDTAGGRGIAVQVDHLVFDEVAALVARIAEEQGALHILVNNIWGATKMEWIKPFGNPIWHMGCERCVWRWTPTPSPVTLRYRCSSSSRAGW